MNGLTDQELLREYAVRRAEAAFGELVRRHVDLVYSAALRMVRDAHLAEDVTQSVFLALSRSAGQLTQHPVLSGWLHRTTQNLAANAVRSDVRRRAHEPEAAAMNDRPTTEPGAAWEDVAPHLDEAPGELSDPDRGALLLRYFVDNKLEIRIHPCHDYFSHSSSIPGPCCNRGCGQSHARFASARRNLQRKIAQSDDRR